MSQNVTLSLDTLCLISTSLVSINLLTSFTTLRAYHMDGVFEFPLFLFSVMLVICLGVSAISLTYKREDPTEGDLSMIESMHTFTTNTIRLKLIIINSLSLVTFLIIPMVCLPDQAIDILRDKPMYPFHFKNASSYSVILCLVLGLIGQNFIMFIGEYFTSHGFIWTQESGKKTLYDSSHGMLNITRNASLAHMCLVTAMGLMIFISYSQAGFYGVMLLGISFIVTPSYFLSVSLFSFICEEALLLCALSSDLSFSITERLKKLEWAAGNY